MSNGKVLSNIIWRFAERAGAQGVNFVVSIILARMLSPDDYGLVALVAVFITIMQVFVDSGFGNALIQKKDADEIDFSSVFWFNISVGILLYIFLFIFSGLIAQFYRKPELSIILRVLGAQVIVAAVKNVEQAYISRTMQFKRFFYATLGGTIGAAIVGIWMAKKGYGVWALVTQQLLNTIVDTIILWYTIKWRPQFVFSIERLKLLFAYGWKVLITTILGNANISVRQLIIGRVYSTADLAFYNKGDRFPYLFIVNIDASIGSVMLPVMAKEQDDYCRVKSITRRAMKTSLYIIAPFMIGLICVAESFVSVLLTDKWLPCVPYMRLLCVAYICYPMSTANLNAILAVGRSDLYLRLEIVKDIIGLILLLFTMRISTLAMAWSVLIASVLCNIVNTWPNWKLLNYSCIEQAKDVLPEIVLSIIMGTFVFSISYLGMNNLLTLFIQIFVGAIIYLLGSSIFKLESYMYLKKSFVELFYRKTR